MKFTVAVFLFLFGRCNSSNTPADSSTKETQSRADSLMHEVLQQHDIGMAKMSKLSGARTRIQQALDSLSKLQGEAQHSSEAYKNQLDSVLNRLTVANGDMETWMDEFNMDSLKDNKEEQAKYLESEKMKIAKVNEAMISSLQKADSLLER